MNIEYSFWERLLFSWKTTYFSSLFWLLCGVLALVICFKYYKAEMLNKLFIIYIIASIAILNIGLEAISYFLRLNKPDRDYYLEFANLFFLQIEALTFCTFFEQAIRGKLFPIIKKILALTICLSLALLILFICGVLKIDFKFFERASYQFNLLELGVFLTCCILYYTRILLNKIDFSFKLSDRPTFWIFNGLFFYTIISIPFITSGQLLRLNNKDFYITIGSIHYFSMGILLLFVSKAFLCKKSLAI